MFKDIQDSADQPPHPGEILREDILPELDLSPGDLARHLAINERELCEFLTEARPVTPDLAQRLAAALGRTARYWLSLQLQFDLFRAHLCETAGVTPVPLRKRRSGATQTAVAAYRV